MNNGIISGWVQTVRNGYQRRVVALRKNKRTHFMRVHHLVLLTFVGPRPNGSGALHANGDSLDNRLTNLRWGTQAENILDSKRHGSFSKPPTFYGEAHHNTTISSADIAVIRSHKFKRGDQAAFARKFGVADITISRIRKGLSRAHG